MKCEEFLIYVNHATDFKIGGRFAHDSSRAAACALQLVGPNVLSPTPGDFFPARAVISIAAQGL
jgi:hypothetical protein